MGHSTSRHPPQLWVEDETPRASLEQLWPIAPHALQPAVGPHLARGEGLRGWDCTQEVSRLCLLGSQAPRVVVDACWGLARLCPQAVWGQGHCLGQRGGPRARHPPLHLAHALSVSLSVSVSLSQLPASFL